MQKNKSFKVAPMGHASDTIIAYYLGGLSLVFVVLSIVKSIISKGHVERVYGVLLVCALVMSVTGMVFSLIGYRAEEGSMLGKRISAIINVLSFVISGLFLITGL